MRLCAVGSLSRRNLRALSLRARGVAAQYERAPATWAGATITRPYRAPLNSDSASARMGGRGVNSSGLVAAATYATLVVDGFALTDGECGGNLPRDNVHFELLNYRELTALFRGLGWWEHGAACAAPATHRQ